MKRCLDIIIFAGCITLIAIANNGFFGISLSKKSQEIKTSFAPNLNIVEILYTKDYAPKVSGYGGQIPIAIGLDKAGIIKDIKVLANTETPTFLNQVLDTDILKEWIGKNVANANTKVDAVSGATMSSEAIIKSINQTIDAKNGKAINKNPALEKYNTTKTLCILFVGLLGLFSFFAPKKANKIRPFLQATIIFVLGIWQGSMLSVAKISAWMIHGVPDYYLFSLLPILVISIIIPMATGKNFYCYNMCPFGCAQDLVSQSIKTNIKVKTIKWLMHARIVILTFCFLMLLFGYTSYVALLEPFSAFKPEHAPLICIAIFVLSLFASIFVARPWCKYFCPCGAFLDLFKKN